MATPIPPSTPRYLFHYTKASTAFNHIFTQMTMRLSKLRDTNDPWEAPPQQSGRAREAAQLTNFDALITELHSAVSLAQLACFCSDDTTSPVRGWGTIVCGPSTRTVTVECVCSLTARS